jgi:protein phosphatase
MIFESYALSDKGLKRLKNEDSYLINQEKNLFLIADGMGGHEKGEIASKIAVETINEVITKHRLLNITNKKHLPNIIQEAIEVTTEEIINYTSDKEISSKMGTTIAGLYKNKNLDELCIFHMGDSRVYRIRNNNITLLTKDHTTYSKAKIDNPEITEEELEKISKHQLSRAIGNFGLCQIEVNFHELKNDDIYILCTDGVSNFIEEEYLLRMALKSNLNELVYIVKDIVYKNKARDNLSLIVTRFTK